MENMFNKIMKMLLCMYRKEESPEAVYLDYERYKRFMLTADQNKIIINYDGSVLLFKTEIIAVNKKDYMRIV